MITGFSIWKNDKKEKDTQPDYKLSAKVQVGNEYIFTDIGAGFVKETQGGKKYISCSMKKEYEDKDGFVIVTTKQYKAMKQAYDDWQIKLKDPEYPTPTEKGLDMNNVLVKPEELDIDPDFINF